MKRCEWAHREPLISYHDSEWGIPVHDDQVLFEHLVLDGAQAGLSWETILKRRTGYQEAFANFDPIIIASYDQQKVEDLMGNPRIIRNRQKIESAITNANAFLEVQKEFGTFDTYFWQFTGGKTIKNVWRTMQEVPAITSESKAMSKDLMRRGFRFVGPTICYAIMQAAGLVNDHTIECYRYNQV
jgi:DNA-3-methyladenine glycosylase I